MKLGSCIRAKQSSLPCLLGSENSSLEPGFVFPASSSGLAEFRTVVTFQLLVSKIVSMSSLFGLQNVRTRHNDFASILRPRTRENTCVPSSGQQFDVVGKQIHAMQGNLLQRKARMLLSSASRLMRGFPFVCRTMLKLLPPHHCPYTISTGANNPNTSRWH